MQRCWRAATRRLTNTRTWPVLPGSSMRCRRPGRTGPVRLCARATNGGRKPWPVTSRTSRSWASSAAASRLQASSIPGDFPYVVYSKFSAQMHMRAEVAPGLEGGFDMTVLAERYVEREVDGQLLEWVAPDYPLIVIGETVTGWLGEGSEAFGDGTYADYYIMYGDRGDDLAITLTTDDFAAYLVLLDSNREIVAWGEAMGASADAFVRVELPYSGVYYVVANAYYPGTGGHYTLTVQREAASVGGVDVMQLISAASALLPSLEDVRSMPDEELAELEYVLDQLLQIIWDERTRRLWQKGRVTCAAPGCSSGGVCAGSRAYP